MLLSTYVFLSFSGKMSAEEWINGSWCINESTTVPNSSCSLARGHLFQVSFHTASWEVVLLALCSKHEERKHIGLMSLKP